MFFSAIVFLCGLTISVRVIAAQAVDEYYWWDGAQKRSIKVVENVLVEVPGQKHQIENQTKSQIQQKISEKFKLLPATFKVEKIVKENAFTKIHVQSSHFYEDIKQDLGGQFSPLFADGASEKFLAGGVIVTFKKVKTDEEAISWAKNQGLNIKEKVGLLNGRTWLIEAVAGLQSLNLANQLHDSPDLESAQPNWSHDFINREVHDLKEKKSTHPLSLKNKDKQLLNNDMLKPVLIHTKSK